MTYPYCLFFLVVYVLRVYYGKSLHPELEYSPALFYLVGYEVGSNTKYNFIIIQSVYCNWILTVILARPQFKIEQRS